jgi:hypothetical protein
MVVVLSISIIIGMLTHKVDIVETLCMILIFGGVAITFLSIVLPLFFKFGMEKGRLIMMIVVFLPTILAFVISKSGIQPPSKNILDMLPYALPISVVVIVFLSIQISIAIYNKKEF